jgi:abelson tyrosine-protein kinase 1
VSSNKQPADEGSKRLTDEGSKQLDNEGPEETNLEKVGLRPSLKPVTDDTHKSHENGVEKRLEKVSDKYFVEKIKLKPNDKTSAVTEETKEETEELDDDDRRKSTGSISSLVKMWETEEKASPAEERPASVVKFEKRVWPPVPSTETEKPMVPVKPTVKPPPTSRPPPPKEPAFKPVAKPISSAKPAVCNIYAAPSAVSGRSGKPNISTSKPRLPSARGQPETLPEKTISAGLPQTKPEPDRTGSSSRPETGSGDRTGSSSSSSLCDKDMLVGSSQDLEKSLVSLGTGGVTTATAMTVSEQVGTFHSSCASYVDSIPATGRFRFRSLLAKLDNQGKELRSVNINKKSQNTQLVKDMQVTVRDLVTVIQR